MEGHPVRVFRVKVIFDPLGSPTITLQGALTNGGSLAVPQGLHMIFFELETTHTPAGDEATFPVYPIEWVNPEETSTVPPPECFQTQWHDQRRFTLVAFNSFQRIADVPDNNQYAFNVVVFYKGRTYGTDPTIILEPPGLPP